MEISQVGKTVDNTIKTRCIFEINKGSNKNTTIDVNSFIPHEDRRIPIDQMIYIADGPSDVPVFTVVKQMGGKTYAVYNPENENEFAQTCDLVERARVHNNGPADYRKNSPTSIWMKQKTKEILRTMVKKRADQLNERTGRATATYPRQYCRGRNIYTPSRKLFGNEVVFIKNWLFKSLIFEYKTFSKMGIPKWKPKNLLGIESLSKIEIRKVLSLAKELKHAVSLTKIKAI